jgi:copper(I)-binding protein
VIRTLGLALGIAIASTSVCAGAAPPDPIRIVIVKAFIRAVPAGAGVAAGYLQIDNRGAVADRLLSVSTPAAGSAEIHEMRMEDDLMRMRKVASVEVPAGGHVELKPGGLHIMLTRLERPLMPGDRVRLELRFEHAGIVAVVAPVGSLEGAERQP